jgi:hypothetical protein
MTARNVLSVLVMTAMTVLLAQHATIVVRAPSVLVMTAMTAHLVPSARVMTAMTVEPNAANVVLRRSIPTSRRSLASRRKTMLCLSDSKHRQHLRPRLRA